MAERYRLYLTEEEQTFLKGIRDKKKSPAKRLVRTQVLLAVAENGLNKDAGKPGFLGKRSIVNAYQ
jgi:hypothetical protein